MTGRVRLLHFVVQPIIGIDDGGDGGVPPAAQQAQPQQLSLEQTRELIEHWPEHFEALKAQYEAHGEQPAEPPKPAKPPRTRPRR